MRQQDTKYIPNQHGTAPIAVEETQDPSDTSISSTDKPVHKTDAKVLAEEVHASTIPRKTYRQKMSLFTTSPGGLKTFLRHSYQPFIILFTFPAVTYTAIIYGSLLAWFSVIVSVYSVYFTLPPYNFSASGVVSHSHLD